MNTLHPVLSLRTCLSLSQLTEVLSVLSLPLAIAFFLLSFTDEDLGKAVSLTVSISLYDNFFNALLISSIPPLADGL